MEEEKLDQTTIDQEPEQFVEKKRKKKKEKKQKVKVKNPITFMDIAKKVLAFCAILMLILPVCGTLIFYLLSA